MVSEVAEAWEWDYQKAYARLARAFERGQLTRIQRPGHQPYYLAHQIEALFGPPTCISDGSSLAYRRADKAAA